jgi:hypothetical protein
VALTLRSRAVIAEECFDAVGEVRCLLPIDMNDQSRAFSVAVVDDEREFVEPVRVAVGLELVGDGVSEIVESSIRRGAIHDSPRRWLGTVLQLSADARERVAGWTTF